MLNTKSCAPLYFGCDTGQLFHQPGTRFVHIRAALPEEAELLGELACTSKAWWGYPSPQVELWREELSPTPASIASQPTCIAEVDGVAAGFYQLYLGDSDRGELKNLWVLPAYMRQGIGAALLAHAAARAGRGKITSLTINADPNAEPFYLSQGAIRVGSVPSPIPGEPGRILPQMLLGLTIFAETS